MLKQRVITAVVLLLVLLPAAFLRAAGLLFAAADKFFWLALRNTLTFVLFAVPFSVIPALVLSNVLNSKLPGMKFYRAVYFMPSIAAVVGISLVWQWLYNATVGYINYFITVGIEFWNNLFNVAVVDPKIQWVSDEKTALLAVIIIAAWQTKYFVLLAGIVESKVPVEIAFADDGLQHCALPRRFAEHPR